MNRPLLPVPDPEWPRCCADTYAQNGPKAPTEGYLLDCNWCMDSLMFQHGKWVRVLGKFPFQEGPITP